MLKLLVVSCMLWSVRAMILPIVLSKFMMKPRKKHIKGVFRYLKGTLGLEFGKYTENVYVVGYTTFEFANDSEFRRSISLYIFTIYGNCISSKFRLQFDVALSTT